MVAILCLIYRGIVHFKLLYIPYSCGCLYRVVVALVMAGVQSGRISAFLPYHSNAILSARRVFQLSDTEPGIDS